MWRQRGYGGERGVWFATKVAGWNQTAKIKPPHLKNSVLPIHWLIFLPFQRIPTFQSVSFFFASLYKSKESLCVCVCVYVFLKYLCRSGSDLPESFNMAAAWFKGVRRRICLDCNDTVNKLFYKCFTNSAERCPPEPGAQQSLFGSEEIRRRTDNKVESESVDVRV